MTTMRAKLETMVDAVRREMAAVRRCDVLLRNDDENNSSSKSKQRSDHQLNKLVDVLRRVLPKWELEHNGKPFLYRGVRYLDLVDALLEQREREQYAYGSEMRRYR